MEKMEEEIPDSEYRAYQHFLTNSKWNHKGVPAKVRMDTCKLLKANKKRSKKLTGLIVDDNRAGLVDERLFIPKTGQRYN